MKVFTTSLNVKKLILTKRLISTNSKIYPSWLMLKMPKVHLPAQYSIHQHPLPIPTKKED